MKFLCVYFSETLFKGHSYNAGTRIGNALPQTSCCQSKKQSNILLPVSWCGPKMHFAVAQGPPDRLLEQDHGTGVARLGTHTLQWAPRLLFRVIFYF